MSNTAKSGHAYRAESWREVWGGWRQESCRIAAKHQEAIERVTGNPPIPLFKKVSKSLLTLGAGGGRRSEDLDAAVRRVLQEVRPAFVPGANSVPDVAHLMMKEAQEASGWRYTCVPEVLVAAARLVSIGWGSTKQV